MDEDNNSRISSEEACVTSKDDYLNSNKLTDSTNTTNLQISSNVNNDNKKIIEEEAVDEDADPENTNDNDDENDENNDLQITNQPNEKTGDEKNNFKSCQLALSRIKTIMKLDPDLGLVSKESLFVITKATVREISIKKILI